MLPMVQMTTNHYFSVQGYVKGCQVLCLPEALRFSVGMFDIQIINRDRPTEAGI